MTFATLAAAALLVLAASDGADGRRARGVVATPSAPCFFPLFPLIDPCAGRCDYRDAQGNQWRGLCPVDLKRGGTSRDYGY